MSCNGTARFSVRPRAVFLLRPAPRRGATRSVSQGCAGPHSSARSAFLTGASTASRSISTGSLPLVPSQRASAAQQRLCRQGAVVAGVQPKPKMPAVPPPHGASHAAGLDTDQQRRSRAVQACCPADSGQASTPRAGRACTRLQSTRQLLLAPSHRCFKHSAVDFLHAVPQLIRHARSCRVRSRWPRS